MKKISLILICLLILNGNCFSQNIAINTSGTAAAATNMLEVTQTSTAANMVAIYAINSGATAGTGYGLYATKTGAGTANVAGYFSATGGTSNYAGIFENGNVGIGTTTPATPLNIVRNSSQIPGTIVQVENTNAGTQAYAGVDVITNNAAVSMRTYGSGWNNTFSHAGFNLAQKAELWAAPYLVAGLPDAFLIGITAPSPIIFCTTDAERMRLDASGDLGIGTTAPGTLLEVKGAGTGKVNLGQWTGSTNYGSVYLNGAYATSGSYNLISSPGDPNLYINRPTGQHIYFRENNGGTSQMSILSGGNVGIGTNTPGNALTVYTAGGAAPLGAMSVDVGSFSSAANAQASYFFRVRDVGAGSTPFYIRGDGNVGVGTTNPRVPIESGSTLTNPWTGGTPVGHLLISDKGNIGMGMGVSNVSATYQGWIQAGNNASAGTYYDILLEPNGGNVGIGCTSPQYKLHVVGNAGVVGTIYATAASVTSGVVACSDIRYKKDISTLTNSLEKVLALRGVNYFWKTNEFPDKNFTTDKQVGFIAQELEKIYPELVFTDNDGYKTVDYTRLTPILAEAIKELAQRNAKLEEYVYSQQKTIDQLKTTVANLESYVRSMKEVVTVQDTIHR